MTDTRIGGKEGSYVRPEAGRVGEDTCFVKPYLSERSKRAWSQA